MQQAIHWMIAAVGADARQTRRAGYSCVHLCARLSESGCFSLLSLPAGADGDYLGIADGGGIPEREDVFAREAVSAACRRGCRGILADFERAELSGAAAALDAETERRQLELYLPLPLAAGTRHACAVADTAVSGGSLSGYFSELLTRFPPERLAAQLTCSRADFPLPAYDPDGEPLSEEDFSRLLRQTGAAVFFSRELCAKYFTYSRGGQAHFVLFDDADTLRAKVRTITELGIRRLLAVYPDAQSMKLL